MGSSFKWNSTATTQKYSLLHRINYRWFIVVCSSRKQNNPFSSFYMWHKNDFTLKEEIHPATAALQYSHQHWHKGWLGCRSRHLSFLMRFYKYQGVSGDKCLWSVFGCSLNCMYEGFFRILTKGGWKSKEPKLPALLWRGNKNSPLVPLSIHTWFMGVPLPMWCPGLGTGLLLFHQYLTINSALLTWMTLAVNHSSSLFAVLAGRDSRKIKDSASYTGKHW